jgi:pimeloyl-ACP methyl ester carboxylesterase
MRVVFVHGACVRDGSWWWHRTAALLLDQGVQSVTPALPSCGEAGVPAGGAGPGLAEDVEAVRTVLEDGDEPTIVVAHSYGGIVTAEAAAGVDSVRHLLLVSSYLPDVGQSLSDFGDGGPAPFLDIDPDAGTFGVRPELGVDTFLHDCDPDIQAEALDHLSRQSVRVTGQAVGAAAWQQVPTTYLVRPGQGHPGPTAARVRPPRRHRRRARRRPPPLPVPARRRTRPATEAVTANTAGALEGPRRRGR